MPRANRHTQTIEVERGALAAAIMDHPREFVGILMAVAAAAAIFINALFLQRGPHPAPIFAAPPPAKHQPAVTLRPQTVPGPAMPEAAAQSRGEIVSDIQRELATRGFYDGAVDGIWGSKTDSAVRDFALTAGLKIHPEANAGLLRTIAASPVRRNAAPAPARNDPIAQLLAPSKRVLAVQSALSDFGYGQIKPSGVYDADTRAAIEKFERDRRMPVTGQLTEGVVREIAAVTGRPLE